MNTREQKRTISFALALAFAIAVIAPMLLAGRANAAQLTNALVKFDRMKASTATTGTVCAKATTVGTEATVDVTFPSTATLGAFGTFTVNTTGVGTDAWPAASSAWIGIGTATAVAGQVVTFPSGDLVVGTLYCFNWINSAAVTTGTAGVNLQGAIATYATGLALIDSAPYATAFIADDQIVVTANITPTFSFALSGNTDALGTVVSGTISTSPTPRTATVNTNAQNGWYVWAKDLNQGLTSVSAGYTIPSKAPIGTNSTLANNVAAYNTGITSSQVGGTGTLTVATPFVGGVLGKGNGLSNTAFQTLASSNGSADTAVLTINNNVAIAPSTPAATDYTDTITVVAAGLF